MISLCSKLKKDWRRGLLVQAGRGHHVERLKILCQISALQWRLGIRGLALGKRILMEELRFG